MASRKRRFFQHDEEYLGYVNGTLIPDLRASGRDFTADDLATLAGMVNFGYYDKDSQEFAKYLKKTLIPDLRASGHVETAHDFANGLVLWNANKRKRRIYRASQRSRRG